ncbi:MAG: hypothetical protein JWO94_1691, partial [Verrucomicrobiaceae bacterium]|nr:hypothetical protein [Verrucomicrobiaceae bacterium]
MAANKKSSGEEPWDKPAPRNIRHIQLSSRSKTQAKAAAKKAGRKYPSLVDNMNAAKKQKKAAAAARPSAKKSQENPKKTPTKDPKGGLTAAGRREFAKTQGAHLKPGVKKAAGKMSAEEMRRK